MLLMLMGDLCLWKKKRSYVKRELLMNGGKWCWEQKVVMRNEGHPALPLTHWFNTLFERDIRWIISIGSKLSLL